MTKNTISIIIRNYNSASTVSRAINSVLKQSLPREQLEIIVIDDGSSDSSLEKIKPYMSKINFTETPRLGPQKTLNAGLKKSSGEFYTILDSDDYLPPTCLEKMMTLFAEDSDLGVVYGDYLEFISDSKHSCYYSTSGNIFNTLAGGILFKKQIVENHNFYDESLVFPEYDLIIKLKKKHKMQHLLEISYHYYRHPKSITADNDLVSKGIKQLNKKYDLKIPIRSY